jgi:hypothetical protein
MAWGSGTVVLAVSIDATGEIQGVKVIKGVDGPPPGNLPQVLPRGMKASGGGFESSALEGIKKWKFKPATLEGKPISSVVPVAFSFGWPVACGGGIG